jgi:hypothetical protein
MFNAKGEALPIAFVGDREPVPEAATIIPMQIFPVAAEERPDSPQGSVDVQVKSDANGTIVSVQGRTAGKPAPARTAAWIVDATRAGDSPVGRLVFSWNVQPGTEVVKVDVEASDDLKSWHRIASRAPLMHLERDGMTLEQNVVDLNGQKVKYLRITGEPAQFELQKVNAISMRMMARDPFATRVVDGSIGTQPGEYFFDLGARLPVQRARIILPTNTVAPFTLSTREDDKMPWRRVMSGTFYNLVRDGATFESREQPVNSMPMRNLMAQRDLRSPPLMSPPKLEVHWIPAQIVFVARGEGPYHLEFGQREAKSSILAVNQLIPDYKSYAEWKVPEARVGDVKANGPPEPAWRAAIGDTNPRKVALWSILVVAVLVLAGMAWRLSKQIPRSKG